MKPDALLQHYGRHRVKLVAGLSRLVKREEAEELADEALTKALSSIERFRGEADIDTWLHRIAVNLAYDLLRRQKRHPEISLEEAIELPEHAFADAGQAPQEQREMSQCVRNLLTTLPPEQHEALIHADIHDLTAAEIARNTGVSTGNAKIRLHRARRAMKSLLETHCDLAVEADGVCRCTPKAAE